jgi:tetratricopeptide (TPR) repeat protein
MAINRIEKLTEMLNDNPTDCFVMFALGLENIKLQNNEAALNLFKKILITDENYSGVYYHLGKLYERLNDTANAEITYEKGLEICKKLKEQHNYNELRGALDAMI